MLDEAYCFEKISVHQQKPFTKYLSIYLRKNWISIFWFRYFECLNLSARVEYSLFQKQHLWFLRSWLVLEITKRAALLEQNHIQPSTSLTKQRWWQVCSILMSSFWPDEPETLSRQFILSDHRINLFIKNHEWLTEAHPQSHSEGLITKRLPTSARVNRLNWRNKNIPRSSRQS